MPTSNEKIRNIQKLMNDRMNVQTQQDIAFGTVIGLVSPEMPQGYPMYFGNLIDRSDPPQPLPLNGQTQFYIGSVSKVFTTAMFHYALGINAWNSPLSSFIGGSFSMSEAVQQIAASQCADYASGLPQDNGDCQLHPKTGLPADMYDSLGALSDVLATYAPPCAPRTVYTYSNLAFVLLGMAAAQIQSVDDDTYSATLLKLLQYCCSQFGVNAGENLSTTMYPSAPAGPVPVGYNEHFQPVISPPCPAVKGPSGGIISTGDDMLKFLLYQMSSPDIWYLQPRFVWSPLASYCNADKWGPKLGPTVGLGWMVSEITAGGRNYAVTWKNGSVAGFTAWIGFVQRLAADENSTTGVFVLENGPLATADGFATLTTLLGGTPAEVEALPPDLPTPDTTLD